MNQQSILLVSHGSFEKEIHENLNIKISREFHYPVRFEESTIGISEFYDPGRRQYDANQILQKIELLSSNNVVKAIGLFRVDLFIPILTYIFGQAIYKGNSGIASLYRLRNEQYGMKKDDLLLNNRFCKVVIHELGHTFGLKHCYNTNCVMRSSTYVEDIDQKSGNLCMQCRTEIELL